MHIAWLPGTELHGEEAAPGYLGLVGEEAAAVLEGEVVEAEVEEDLRGASSVEEGAEEAGADMSAPSPGEDTWTRTAAFYGNKWTNLDTQNTVTMKTWCGDVITVTY